MPAPSQFANGVDGKELVRAAVDLVALVGETVKLKRVGRRYTGLCPFHSEKSPSFGVDPEKGYFHCFGCKKGGDCFTFVMERDRCDFRTALTTLADWAGVELPKFGGPNKEQIDRLQHLRDATSAAAGLFRKALLGDGGKAARDYMIGRGFDDATLEKFGVGFAPDAWDFLATEGLPDKFGDDALLDAGLIKTNERGNTYDVFRGRVIFPIRDEQGRPIAFGGRVLPGSDSPAKYLNSPETPLFSKSRVLFGVDVAKAAIVKSRTAVVFEGYADAAMAHQHGIDNAVAVLGTALTPEHAAVLRRLADRIVLVFDADAAGGMATRRSVELFLSEPVEVAVAELPAGTDPDEFLLKHGADAFRKIVDAAADALTYQWRQLQTHAGGGVTAVQQATEAYLKVLDEARRSAGSAIDSMRWGAILTRVAKHTGLSSEELHRRFAPRQTHRGPARGPARPHRAGTTAAASAGAELLGALFVRPALWEKVQPHVQLTDFADRQQHWLAETFWEHLRHEGEPVFGEWLGVVESAVLSAGGDADRAGRARSTCIQYANAAEAKADSVGRDDGGIDGIERVAAEAVASMRRLRERRELDELIHATRRMGGDSGVPQLESPVGDAEAELLRSLTKRLAEAGRVKPASGAAKSTTDRDGSSRRA